MRVLVSDEFKRRYGLLPQEIKEKLIKQQDLLLENKNHPSLHTEKLSPKGRNVWSFRIDRQYRVSFRYLENGDLFFLTVGTHDWVYRRM